MMYTETQLEELRTAVGSILSPRRFAHCLSVEKEAADIGEILLPDGTDRLRAAALLHDITKEMTPLEQAALCRRMSSPLSEEDLRFEATLHEKSAPCRILSEFPQFADPVVLNAVRQHATGSASMSLFDKILFLADYTEASRTYESCVAIRRRFWEALPVAPSPAAVLDGTVLEVLRVTMLLLLKRGALIDPLTIAAYNRLQSDVRRAEQR